MSAYLRKELTLTDLARLTQQPPVCDFCASHAPQFMYAASRTTAGLRVQCWRWCACPDCATLVEAQNWRPLILFIEATLKKMNPGFPPRLIRQAVDLVLGDFHDFAIRTGEK